MEVDVCIPRLWIRKLMEPLSKLRKQYEEETQLFFASVGNTRQNKGKSSETARVINAFHTGRGEREMATLRHRGLEVTFISSILILRG